MSSSPIKESWTCKDTTTEALEEKMSVGGKKQPLYILWFAYTWKKWPQQPLILATCVVDSKVFQLVVNSACSFGILIDALGCEPCESLFLSVFLPPSGFITFALILIKWYRLIGENLKQHSITFEYMCFLIICLDMLLGIGISCTFATVKYGNPICVSIYFIFPITLIVDQQLRHFASSV